MFLICELNEVKRTKPLKDFKKTWRLNQVVLPLYRKKYYKNVMRLGGVRLQRFIVKIIHKECNSILQKRV